MSEPAHLDRPALWLAIAGFVLVNVAVLLHFLADVPRWLVTATLVLGALAAAGAWWRLRRSR